MKSCFTLLSVKIFRDSLHWALLLCFAGLENLVRDPKMLTQVGNLLSTLGTRIPGLEVDKLCVRVVVRLLVRLVITELAAVPVKRENSDKGTFFFGMLTSDLR